jgi:hypothetical protein
MNRWLSQGQLTGAFADRMAEDQLLRQTTGANRGDQRCFFFTSITITVASFFCDWMQLDRAW